MVRLIILFGLIFLSANCRAAFGCYISGHTVFLGATITKAGSYNDLWAFSSLSTIYVNCPTPLRARDIHAQNPVIETILFFKVYEQISYFIH